MPRRETLVVRSHKAEDSPSVMKTSVSCTLLPLLRSLRWISLVVVQPSLWKSTLFSLWIEALADSVTVLTSHLALLWVESALPLPSLAMSLCVLRSFSCGMNNVWVLYAQNKEALLLRWEGFDSKFHTNLEQVVVRRWLYVCLLLRTKPWIHSVLWLISF